MSSSYLTPTSNETGANKGKNVNRRLSLANIVDELNSKRDKRIDTRYSYKPSNNRKSLATSSNASKTESSNGSSQPSFMSSIIDIGPPSQPDFLSSKIPISKKDLDVNVDCFCWFHLFLLLLNKGLHKKPYYIFL